MTKFSAFVLILTLRIFIHPIPPSTLMAPFANTPSSSISNPPITTANVIQFSGSISDKKIILNWTVNENETADQFEVEKSIDGTNFTMAALVFGTDLPHNGEYQFYEKATNQKVLYRIKLINKNRSILYSKVIEVSPSSKISNN